MHVDQEEVWVALSITDKAELGDFAYGRVPVAWLESDKPPADFCRLEEAVFRSGESLLSLRGLTRDTVNDTNGILCVYWHSTLMLWPVTDAAQVARLRHAVSTRTDASIAVDDEPGGVADIISELVAQSRFVLDLQRIEFGMTREQVEMIMGRYDGTGWTQPDPEDVEAPESISPEESSAQTTWPLAMRDYVMYRYTADSAFSVVRFENGRAVGILFSPE